VAIVASLLSHNGTVREQMKILVISVIAVIAVCGCSTPRTSIHPKPLDDVKQILADICTPFGAKTDIPGFSTYTVGRRTWTEWDIFVEHGNSATGQLVEALKCGIERNGGTAKVELLDSTHLRLSATWEWRHYPEPTSGGDSSPRADAGIGPPQK